MGSTGEPDRKRRQISSISPTAANAKKQQFMPKSDDKKLDTTVLQFQNQKLVQKLESQKIEHIALENKFSQLRKKQQPYDNTIKLVKNSWKEVVDDLESSSVRTKGLVCGVPDAKYQMAMDDGILCPLEDDFLSRLLGTGATESSSTGNIPNCVEEVREVGEKCSNVLRNIVTAINELWHLKDGLYPSALKNVPEDGSFREKASSGLVTEVKALRQSFGDLHLKHKSLARELQNYRDGDAKNKAELKSLRGELECTLLELEDSNCKLATLKAESDAAKGTAFPVLTLGGKHLSGDRTRDKQKDMQDMQTAHKELVGQASSRLVELKLLHEERIGILKKLSNLQNTLKSVKCISSSQAYALVKDQLAKSKADVVQYQALFEKLQVEKDNLAWRERELIMKSDLVDAFHRSSVVVDTRTTELEMEIQKLTHERNQLEIKLEEASREPGRKEIITEFKALVSTFPDDMSSMQSQLSKYKESATDIHSLRADIQSLSNVFNRKAKELDNLCARSADQVAEMKTLQAVVHDLGETDRELKLILEMHRREYTDSRDILEAMETEYRTWAHVQTLKSSLDDHHLELRVKTAIEAEAISQQTLAAAEAEIADLRQKLEASKRAKLRLSDDLKSKNEENEAYISEIESIGQAYDDMQTQNQHLLQQITEKDDYNIKLVLEGARARQLRDLLLMEKQTMENTIQQANISVEFFDMKAGRIEDQLKICSDQVQRLTEDRFQNSSILENNEKKLLDVRKSSHHLRELLEGSQSKVCKSRHRLAEMQIALEKERFEKKRIEEELEIARRQALRLKSHIEGSSVVERLQEELSEYREILKCSICLDRPKEVVITKCYHLFCNTCVQRILESRHRKCKICSATFSANDVKPVYI